MTDLNISNDFGVAQPKSTADHLIEQSKKRIQDISELMRPPADIMSSYLKKEGDARFDSSFL